MVCPEYRWDERADFLQTPSGKRMLKRFNAAEREIQKFGEAVRWALWPSGNIADDSGYSVVAVRHRRFPPIP